MTSMLSLMDLTISAPDHTTVSRRAVTLPVIQATSVLHGPLHVLIDRRVCKWECPECGGIKRPVVIAGPYWM